MSNSDDLGAKIAEVVAKPADKLLVAYFNPEGRFAGTTFDDLPGNPRDEFSPSDLVAASLLDVRFKPQAVRALLCDQAHFYSKCLAPIPDNRDLWKASADELALANALWEQVIKLPDIGETRTSKLLARKRPRLIPIVDSVIRAALPLGNNTWESLRSALQDEELRRSIEAIRPRQLAPTTSILRLLDAATWMRYSKSKNARQARNDAGLD